MPCLAGHARGFDEIHGLHAFDVGSDDLCQHVDHRTLGEIAMHDGRDFVDLVDAQYLLQDLFVGLVASKIRKIADLAPVTTTQIDGVASKLVHFCRQESTGDDEEAVLVVGFDFQRPDSGI